MLQALALVQPTTQYVPSPVLGKSWTTFVNQTLPACCHTQSKEFEHQVNTFSTYSFHNDNNYNISYALNELEFAIATIAHSSNLSLS